jgi:phosphomannomutase
MRLTCASGDVVHLRPSGNAPELRCCTEADTHERAEALCADALQRVAIKVSKLV